MVRLCSPIEAPDREELGIVAMPRFGIPRRESNGQATKVTQVNGADYYASGYCCQPLGLWGGSSI